MRMDFELSLEQQQKLIMTTELRQSIEILQLNTLELVQYLNQKVLENPCLEIESPEYEELDRAEEKADEIDWEKFVNDDDIPRNSWRDEDTDFTFLEFYKKKETLRDHLKNQLGTLDIPDEMRTVGEVVIECINDKGYLTESPEQIASFLRKDVKIIESALKIIQSLEPSGVGATDIAECLLMQMKDFSEDALEIVIVKKYLGQVAANQLNAIAKGEKISVDQVNKAVEKIKTLNPYPGAGFPSAQSIPFILVDAHLEKQNDEYIIHMNDESLPQVYINEDYRSLLKQDKDVEAKNFVKKKLDAALWIIQSIDQRKQTIYRVIECIVNYQKDFLDYGEKFLKPMRLKDIAQELDIHESTVCRATNGKYITTDKGIYELKDFFTSGLGEDVSSVNVKSYIKEIVDKENKKKPLSDAKIKEQLEEQGIETSRRTVAKYREELDIPNSSLRKCF